MGTNETVEVRGRLVESGRLARVEVRGGRVAAVMAADGGPELWVAPGLSDIQVNGYGGFDVNAADPSPEQVTGLVEVLWREGVTAVCPTVVTQSEEQMCRCLDAVRKACERSSLVAHSVLCVHVEGPAISPEDGPRGAHPLEHVRPRARLNTSVGRRRPAVGLASSRWPQKPPAPWATSGPGPRRGRSSASVTRRPVPH